MRRLSLCASLLAVAVCARSATAGLDLTWNACNTSALGADNVVLSCDGSSGAQLFGNFQSPQAISGFLSMDAVIDIRTGAGTLPPFWHFETGGCNEAGLGLSDARPTSLCPSATNATLWGPTGSNAVATITSYDVGHAGAERLRILLTIARSGGSPVAVTAGQNYFAFELDLATDKAESCGGCATPAVIGWSKAILYGSTETVELYQSGTRLASVAVNGGIPGPTVFTVRPESGVSSAPASVDLFGRNLVSGTTAKLTRSGQTDIAGTGTTTSTLGDLLNATFDITGKPDGFWSANVANGGNADALVSAFRTTGAFVVDSMFPRLGGASSMVPVTIYGSALVALASVKLKRTNYPDVMGTGTTVAADGKSLQTTFALSSDLGLFDAEVTNGDGAKKNVPGGFEIVTPLTFSSVSPNTGPNTGPVLLTVGGTGLRSGASVALRRAGESDIVGTSVTVAPAGTSLQAQFDLLGRASGLWDLRVANVGGLPVTAGNVFLIANVPVVTSIEPHVASDAGPIGVVIGGTNFDVGAGARLTRAGQAPILGSAAIVLGGNSLSTTFDLAGRALGLWNVEVTNPGNLSGQLNGGFEIRSGPSVTGVTPNAASDTSVATLVISGSNLHAGATTRLTRNGQPDIVGTSVTVAPGGASLSAVFDLRGRAFGPWNVVVANPDSVTTSLPNGFTLSTTPIVTAIAATSGTNDQTLATGITGSHFLAGLSVRLERPSVAPIPGTVTGTTDGTIDVFFNLAGATTGLYDVVVVNPASLVGRLPAAFEVLQGPPPSTAGIGLTWNACNTSPSGADNVVLNCSTPSVAKLYANFQSTQSIGLFQAMDAVVDIHTDGGTLPPFWHFEVGGCNELMLALTDARPEGACPIASNGNLWGPNGNEATAAITGYDVGHGGLDRIRILVTIARPSTSPTGLSAGQNYFAFELDLATDNASSCGGCTTPAVIGWSQAVLYGFPQNVVLNPSGTRLGTVAVNGGIPGPTVLTVRPEQGVSTAPVSVDLFGRNLVFGTAATLTRGGQTDIGGTATTTSANGNLLHTTFDITDKPDGFWNVNVAGAGNADALVNAFRTTGGFRVDSIFPRLGYQGTTVPVTIYGDLFVAPTSVRLKRVGYPDIVGTGTTVAGNGLSLQTTFALQLADLGVWDVAVTNADSTTKTLPGAFEIATRLTISSVSPSAAPNTATVQLTVSGTGMRSDAGVALRRTGEADIVGTSVIVAPSGTSLQAQFDLVGRPLGLRDVRVTNPGGLPVTAGNVFLIAVQPAVTSIVPNVGSDGGPLTVVIGGSNFSTGAVARLTRTGQAPILGSPPVVSGGTSLTTTFDLTGRAAGLWDVEVENTSGIKGKLSGGFEIRPGPRVTGVTPNAAVDTSIVTLVLSGSNLVPGTTTRLTRSGEADIVGTSVTTIPAGTSLTAAFDIRGRAAGPWNAVVTNPDSVSASLPNGFTIIAIAHVTAISPVFGSDGQVIAAVITGSGFLAGLSTWLERPFVPLIPGSVTQVAPGGTSINASFSLGLAPPGFYDVVVRNPNQGDGRLSAAFEVQGAPGIFTFTPGFGYDTSQVVCTIIGGLFDFGASAELVGSPNPTILGTGTVVAADRNSMTTSFDLRGQPIGARTLRVTQNTGVLAATTPFWIHSNTLLSAPPSGRAEELALASVAPNPTGGPMTVTFTLASESVVRVTVVDVMGREWAELVSGTRPAGRHEARWDGRGRQGGDSPTGMYFIRMEAAGRTFTKRFVLAR